MADADKETRGGAPGGMTIQQENHLMGILDRLSEDLDAKYRKGQAEHGGNLWLKPGMLTFLREEVLDFISYSDVLATQVGQAAELVRQAREAIAAGGPYNTGVIPDLLQQANMILDGLFYAGPETQVQA